MSRTHASGAIRVAGAMAAMVLLATASSSSARIEDPSFLDRLQAKFRPAAPTVRLTYDLVYRLLGVTLFHLGEAQVEAVTGRLGGADSPLVCMMNCHVLPPAAADARAVLRDRFLLVTDTVERRTLVFAQLQDEAYRPLMGAPRRKHAFEVYDFRGSEPFHSRTNMVTGIATNRPSDRIGTARPGQEVMTLLNLLAEVHARQRAALEPATSPRIMARVDGQMRPYAVRTSEATPPGRYPDARAKVLRADVAPAPGAGTRRGHLTAWTMTFDDLMRAAGHPGLAVGAMPVPLRAVPVGLDAELAVGTVRAVLKAAAPAGSPPAPDSSSPAPAPPAAGGGKGAARPRCAIRRPRGTPRGPPRRCRSA